MVVAAVLAELVQQPVRVPLRGEQRRAAQHVDRRVRAVQQVLDRVGQPVQVHVGEDDVLALPVASDGSASTRSLALAISAASSGETARADRPPPPPPPSSPSPPFFLRGGCSCLCSTSRATARGLAGEPDKHKKSICTLLGNSKLRAAQAPMDIVEKR